MQTTTRFSKLTLSSLLLLACLFGFTKAKATHFAAMDISVRYDCSGPTGLDYKVTLDVYYACEVSKTPPIGGFPISYFSVNEGGANNTPYSGNRSVNTNAVFVGIKDQLCDKSLSDCKNPTGYPGFWHIRCEATISLTSRQSDWVFYTSGFARNGGIDNITVNPTNVPNPVRDPEGGLFIEAGLDNLIKVDNETPVFGVSPLPYLCMNQPSSYLNGPYDALNDSIEVINVLPRQDANTPYFYWPVAGQPYYSATNPIASTAANPYKVDPASGTATFTPTVQGKFVLAFRCDKYDRKTRKRIGYTHRDVQISVLPCNGFLPDVSEPQNVKNGVLTPDGKYTTCAGSDFSLETKVSSQTPNSSLYVTANTESISGSQITSTGSGTGNVSGTFSWTPHLGNVGEHILILTGYDSTCTASPIVLKQHKIVTIKVIPSIDAGFDKTFCPGDSTKPIELHVRGADSYKVRWKDINGGPAKALSSDTIQSPLMYPHKLPYPANEVTYLVTAPDVPAVCKNTDTLTLRADTNNSIDVIPHNPIVLCRPDYLQLDAIWYGKSIVLPLTCGTTPVIPDNPNSVDSLFINGNLAGSFDTLGPLTPTFPTDSPNVKQQFLIRRSDLLESGMLYDTLKAIAFMAKNVDPNFQYNNFKIALKCTAELSVSCTKNFQPGTTVVYEATGPTTLVTGLNKFVLDRYYTWDTTQNLIIEICYSANPASAPGLNPIVEFVPTDYVSNLMLSSGTTDVCPVIESPDITRTYARPRFLFYFSEPYSRFTINWYPGDLLSDSTIQQPLAYVPKSFKYYATTVGRSGCTVKDSADVYIPIHDYSVTPADTAICFGETAPLHAKNGFTYKWYEYKDGVYTLATRNATCWDCADPILTPQATTTYKIVVYDSVWCTDTLTARVEVMPLPDVKILNSDTIVKYSQSIQLLVNGARHYNWFQVGSLSNTNISNPIARPTERTDYVVGGVGKNGCRSFDTVTVDVDFRDNLFIPSAFTPNGDGKNDVFHIANLSFQRVMEFRVFNRWGQEVFYSNDNEHGWDGKWKGVPQDLGSYQYFIRLGYPDGLVETYKGEVTLVR